MKENGHQTAMLFVHAHTRREALPSHVSFSTRTMICRQLESNRSRPPNVSKEEEKTPTPARKQHTHAHTQTHTQTHIHRERGHFSRGIDRLRRRRRMVVVVGCSFRVKGKPRTHPKHWPAMPRAADWVPAAASGALDSRLSLSSLFLLTFSFLPSLCYQGSCVRAAVPSSCQRTPSWSTTAARRWGWRVVRPPPSSSSSSFSS